MTDRPIWMDGPRQALRSDGSTVDVEPRTPGGEGDGMGVAIRAAQGAVVAGMLPDAAAEAAVRAAAPILRKAIAEELTHATGVAVRTKLREILAFHNAEFLAEHQIDERVQEIIDLIVPAARLQERPRIAEQFRRSLLDGLEDLDRVHHHPGHVDSGDLAQLIARVAQEVGRG